MQITPEELASARGWLRQLAKTHVRKNFGELPIGRQRTIAAELTELMDLAYQEGWGDAEEAIALTEETTPKKKRRGRS